MIEGARIALLGDAEQDGQLPQPRAHVDPGGDLVAMTGFRKVTSLRPRSNGRRTPIDD
jgi:hypothetical protein